MTTVLTTTPIFPPNISVASLADILAAAILTMLFPTKIVESVLSKWSGSTSWRAFLLPRLPSVTNFFKRTLLTLEKAVSAEEKNADKKISESNSISK